jgi:hypothetical protein
MALYYFHIEIDGRLFRDRHGTRIEEYSVQARVSCTTWTIALSDRCPWVVRRVKAADSFWTP